MSSPINPYANSSVVLTPIPPASQWSSITATLLGLLLGSLATTGAVLRLWQVVAQEPPRHWQAMGSKISQAAPLVGLAIFAITACVLLMLLVSAVSLNAADLRLCQCFILIATVAMLLRTISEPNEAWTPHWPAYGLTISAAIAMGMVLRRCRTMFRNSHHHSLLRQTLGHGSA